MTAEGDKRLRRLRTPDWGTTRQPKKHRSCAAIAARVKIRESQGCVTVGAKAGAALRYAPYNISRTFALCGRGQLMNGSRSLRNDVITPKPRIRLMFVNATSHFKAQVCLVFPPMLDTMGLRRKRVGVNVSSVIPALVTPNSTSWPWTRELLA